MTCPEQDALYRYPWPGQTEVEREALRTHCGNCEVCAQVVARLESARQVLVAEAPEFRPFRQQASWRAIEAQLSQSNLRSGQRWLGATAVLSVVVMMAIVIAQRTTPPGYVLAQGAVRGVQIHDELPLSQALVVRSDAVIVGQDISIEALSGLHLSIEPQDILRLIQGKMQIDLRSPDTLRRLRLRTPHVELSALGAQFIVEVGAQTQVRVASGQLRLQTEAGSQIELGPEQTWTSPAPAAPLRKIQSPRQELTRARALVRHDAAGARRVARAVLQGTIAGPEEVGALAVIADAHRRSGEPRKAADYYGRVAAHPAGDSYAEEALLRQARMLLQVRDFEGALQALASAKQRFSPGDLQPERCAAQAQVWLTRGQALRAADVLEACPSAALTVQDIRRDVARAIRTQAPARAKMLNRPKGN